VRGVLERTRGDVTTSLRQQQLREALTQLEQKIGLEIEPDSAFLEPENDTEDTAE
jgi:hypothetical protein